MRDLHRDLEKQFLSFDELVPYNHNPDDVYSPRLYSILQGTCAQVISLMQNIVAELNSKNISSLWQAKFKDYYDFLNIKGVLSLQVVSPKKKFDKIMTPFALNKYPVPDWWNDYNTTKHELPSGAYVGIMGNVLNALGALAILHDIADLVMKNRTLSTLLDGNKWKVYSKEFIDDYERTKNTTLSTRVIHEANRGFSTYKSEIFFYLCKFG
jgi:hypothetical protein